MAIHLLLLAAATELVPTGPFGDELVGYFPEVKYTYVVVYNKNEVGNESFISNPIEVEWIISL
jgi:hypothetical protein